MRDQNALLDPRLIPENSMISLLASDIYTLVELRLLLAMEDSDRYGRGAVIVAIRDAIDRARKNRKPVLA